MNARDTARVALACLDLTSLNDGDTEADIAALCDRAQGRCGPVAAVCVWPRLAAFARARLPASIAVAAVANFPDGGTDLQRAQRDAGTAVDAGAQELDLVLPYRALLAGDAAACSTLLVAVRRGCPGLKLKVILESGALPDDATIGRAARLALDAGADFLKTSTGKAPVGATPQAARVMLETIGAHAGARTRVGFKAAGGIRRVADAAVYIDLVRSLLGADAAGPARLRLGASALLQDIESILLGADGRPAASPPQAGSSY